MKQGFYRTDDSDEVFSKQAKKYVKRTILILFLLSYLFCFLLDLVILRLFF